MCRRSPFLLPCLVALLVGCAPLAGEDGGTARTGAAPPLWEPGGLEGQPRLAAYRDALPIELGFAPGTTEWRTAPQTIPERLGPDGERHATPGGLLQALMSELGLLEPLGRSLWEQTQRIHRQGDRATGVVLQWGLKDDAIQGQDYRLEMREDAGGWYAIRLETRYQCGRGVSDDGLCL